MADENNIGGKVGLDIGDFKANVAELNRQIKVIDTGFKAAAAGMDDWSNSEQGLQQRISSLNQITDLQKQKIANLTEQYKQIAEAKGKDSKAAQDLQVKINNETAALNKNLKELNDVTSKLDNFGKETNDASKDMNELAKSSENTGNSFKGLATEILKADAIKNIASYALDAAKSILGFSNDSQQAMNNFQVKTGATAEEMGKFKDVADQIYADNLGQNFEDISESMAKINQVTWETGDALKATTEQALLIRNAFGYDVSESINAVNGLMKNFGITSEQAYNLIAQGAQAGADKNGDLLDSLNEYGVQFAKLGLSAEDFTNILITGAQQGAFSIDKVGDAVKEFAIRAVDGSKTTQEGFQQLGLNASAMSAEISKGGDSAKQAFSKTLDALLSIKDPLLQQQAGVALFGTQFEDLGIKGITALRDIGDNANMNADTLKDLNNIRYNDIGSALEGLKRQLLTSVAEPIGKELTPKINDMINSLRNVDTTSIVNGFTWIADNANNIAAGVTSIGVGMATWNVASTVNGLVSAVKAYQLANEGATVSQAILNGVMAANPIMIVVTLVAALAAGLIYLWNTNEGFRIAVIGAWTAISTTLVNIVNSIVTFFTTTIPATFNNFIAIVSQVPAQVSAFFSQLPIIISNFLTQAINIVFQWGTNIIAWVVTTIPQIIENIFNFFNELPGKIGYALGLAIGTVIKWGIDLTSWVTSTIPVIIQNIITFFMQLPENINTIFTNMLNAIVQWGLNTINWINATIPGIINSIVNFFSQLPGKIANWFTNTLNNIKQWGSNLISWASSTIPGIVDTIANFFSSLPGKMLDIGVNMVKGLWDGIKNTTGWLEQKIGEFTSGIVKGAKEKLGIHSPSRVMRDEVGLMIGAGMAEGIENSVRQVNSAMSNLNSQIIADGQVNMKTNISGSANKTNGNIPKTNSITQNVNIYSLTALSPAETARQNRRALQEFALSL